MKFNLKNKTIWVIGPNGMVGKALIKELEGKCKKILFVSKKLNLTNQITVSVVKKINQM